MALRETKGWESGQNVLIYEKQIVTNGGDIQLAKTEQLPRDEIPKPITKKVIYIKAGKPQGKSQFEGPLRDKHIATFPKTYAAFEQGLDALQAKGIPLSELHEVSEGILQTYIDEGITTLENLVAIGDDDIEHFPMGRKLQEQAKKTILILSEDQLDDVSEEVSELKQAFESLQEETQNKVSEATAAAEEATKAATAATEENQSLLEQLEAANKRADAAEAASVEKPAKASTAAKATTKKAS